MSTFVSTFVAQPESENADELWEVVDEDECAIAFNLLEEEARLIAQRLNY